MLDGVRGISTARSGRIASQRVEAEGRCEAQRQVSLLSGAGVPGGAGVHRAQPPGRRARRPGLPAARPADLHDPHAAGEGGRRRVRGRPDARRPDAGELRRGGAGAHARRLPVGVGEGGVLRRESVRQRLPVLRRDVGAQPRDRPGVGEAARRTARLGAAGVVAAARADNRRHRGGGAVGVPALGARAGEGSVTSFHPYLLDRRLRVTNFVVWGAFAAIAIAFFRTQILEHGKFKLQSETNRLRPIILPAPRGIITDRNGRVLADNVPGYTVSLLPGTEPTLDAQVASLRNRLERVAPIIGLDSAGLERVLARFRRAPYQPALVLADAPFAVVSQLEERRLLVPGLVIQTEPKRYYPDSGVAAHLLGSVGEVTEQELGQRSGLRPGAQVGRDGLERQYDDSLRGADGVRFVEVSALGHVVRDAASSTTLRPEAGAAVHTTIDLDLQRYIAKIFPAGQRGAVMALKRGIVTLRSRMNIPCRGGLQFGNRFFRCWMSNGHGDLTLQEAIAQSCAVYFYQLGMKLGLTSLLEDANGWGLR